MERVSLARRRGRGLDLFCEGAGGFSVGHGDFKGFLAVH